MTADKLNRWMTLAANFGVLVGLLVVAYEVNQAAVLVRGELGSSFQDRWIAIDQSRQNPEFASVWSKAARNPDELTDAEVIQLDGYLWSYMDHLETDRFLWELGIFQTHPRVLIGFTARDYFGNAFALSWWSQNKQNLSSFTVDLVDGEIANFRGTEYREYIERLRDGVKR